MELIKENNILVLKMDAPGGNLMTGGFREDIVACLEEAEKYQDDKSVKGLIITCAGRHFSCGADVESLMKRSAEELNELDATGDLPEIHKKQKRAVIMLNELPFPVVSAVKGFSIGSGCEIAANSHIRICESSARIGQPESTFGILPALGGIAKTAEACGLAEAIEMVLTGELISASEAYEKQWCDILCDKNQSFAAALSLIEFISSNFDEYDRKRTPEYVDEFMKIHRTAIKDIRKIGIIGYGKMGQEIFTSFHDAVIDAEYTVICRHDSDVHTEKIQKNLSKALKRGKLTDTAYKISSCNYKFTDSISSLNECDLIIETISEDIRSKREIFAELDKTVKESCIFTSNTSSLRISEVFADVNLHKYMGLHFFYPVKLSGLIEINECCNRKAADAICSALKKDSVYFENEYCFYLNQFIGYTISCAMIVRDRYKTGTSKMMEILSEVFPQHSLLGMVDSIGLDLLSSGDSDINVKRIVPVLDNAKNKYKTLLADGCPGGTGAYLKFVSENENSNNSFKAEDEIILPIISAVLNEAVNASEECGSDITSVLADTVGLSEAMSTYYSRFGYEKICSSLAVLAEELNSPAFVPASEELYNQYFSDK